MFDPVTIEHYTERKKENIPALLNIINLVPFSYHSHIELGKIPYWEAMTSGLISDFFILTARASEHQNVLKE
jgi:hypothetical protein